MSGQINEQLETESMKSEQLKTSRFQVLVAVSMNMAVFGNVALCRLV